MHEHNQIVILAGEYNIKTGNNDHTVILILRDNSMSDAQRTRYSLHGLKVFSKNFFLLRKQVEHILFQSIYVIEGIFSITSSGTL